MPGIEPRVLHGTCHLVLKGLFRVWVLTLPILRDTEAEAGRSEFRTGL